jgi:PPIC-type PPIASE domain
MMAMRTKSQPYHRWGIEYIGLVLVALGWACPILVAQGPATSPITDGASTEASSENSRRWVAVIFGNIPITREEFGEYLIARNTDKLDMLINKRIIEHACREKGVDVTAAEVDAALAEDLRGMNVGLDVFISKVLKQYNKTLYEWKEDVIRPKIAMTKLCKDRVVITDKDYEDAFQAYFGEKVDCRIILFPKGEEKQAMQAYGELRKSDADFDRISKQQASPSLASTGGQIKPIAWHTTGNDQLEKEAFSLQPGEISRLIGTPEGSVVLKCVHRIPADKSKSLAAEREHLQKEIFEKKLQLEMPKLFKELRAQAEPKSFIKRATTQEELEREVTKELKSAASPKKPPVN